LALGSARGPKLPPAQVAEAFVGDHELVGPALIADHELVGPALIADHEVVGPALIAEHEVAGRAHPLVERNRPNNHELVAPLPRERHARPYDTAGHLERVVVANPRREKRARRSGHAGHQAVYPCRQEDGQACIAAEYRPGRSAAGAAAAPAGALAGAQVV